eukprot:105565-Alexandrium_andersonii.AAC.1
MVGARPDRLAFVLRGRRTVQPALAMERGAAAPTVRGGASARSTRGASSSPAHGSGRGPGAAGHR